MTVVTIHKAKTELSKLIARVEAGEVIEIARGKDIVAQLVPKKKPKAERNMGFGAWKEYAGKLPDSLWFDPLPEDELKLWYEGPVEPDR
jgi:antitoxin (DNA-binding transcriptional repressor) of toxin-antitoxin stability system